MRFEKEEIMFCLQRTLVLVHRCMGKGKVHLIEVLPDSSEEYESEQKLDGELHSTKLEQPQLQVYLGNYTLVDDFYVVDVPDTSIVLGVQWLYSIGKYSTS